MTEVIGINPLENSQSSIGARRRLSEIEYRVRPELTPEYLLQADSEGRLINTRMVDATKDPALKEASLRTVAQYYHELAPADKPMSVEDVYNMLCKDGNEAAGRVSVLAAITKLPNGEDVIVSSMRFVYGCDNCGPNLFPIDEMGLIDVPGGWPNELEGKPYGTVATVGRYFIAREARTPVMRVANVPGMLTGNLLRLGFELGKLHNPEIEYFAAIMPKRVVANVRLGGIDVREIPMELKQVPGYPLGYEFSASEQAEILSGSDDPVVKEGLRYRMAVNSYYAQFSRYWLQNPDLASSDPPRLYQFITK